MFRPFKEVVALAFCLALICPAYANQDASQPKGAKETSSTATSPSPSTASDSPLDALNTFVIEHAQALPHAGAQKLAVTFGGGENAGSRGTGFLIGVKGNKVIWKKLLPLKQDVNTAKTDVDCRNGNIVVSFQYPGSAAYVSQTFSFDGKDLKLVGFKEGDPSQAVVDRLIKFAKSGSRAQYEKWTDQDNAIFYPGNYITAENVGTILKTGQKTAMALAAAGKYAQAAERMEIAMDGTEYLISLNGNLGDDVKESPRDWIEAWSDDSIQVAPSVWAPVLKDYGDILVKCKRSKEAKLMHAAAARALAKKS